MIAQNEADQKVGMENRARLGAARFLAELIQLPHPLYPSRTPNPAANLAWLIDWAGGNPRRLQRLARIAWAERLATGKPHWEAIKTASELL